MININDCSFALVHTSANQRLNRVKTVNFLICFDYFYGLQFTAPSSAVLLSFGDLAKTRNGPLGAPICQKLGTPA